MWFWILRTIWQIQCREWLMCHDDVWIEKKYYYSARIRQANKWDFQGYYLKVTENYKLTKEFQFCNRIKCSLTTIKRRVKPGINWTTSIINTLFSVGPKTPPRFWTQQGLRSMMFWQQSDVHKQDENCCLVLIECLSISLTIFIWMRKQKLSPKYFSVPTIMTLTTKSQVSHMTWVYIIAVSCKLFPE